MFNENLKQQLSLVWKGLLTSKWYKKRQNPHVQTVLMVGNPNPSHVQYLYYLDITQSELTLNTKKQIVPKISIADSD